MKHKMSKRPNIALRLSAMLGRMKPALPVTMRLTMAHASLYALIVLGGLVPVLVVATVAAKGVY